jgi:hypothetical protein
VKNEASCDWLKILRMSQIRVEIGRKREEKEIKKRRKKCGG